MANDFDKYTSINADTSGLEDIQRFFGFYDNIYRDPFIGGTAFVFVTKPLLFIDPIAPNKSRYNEYLAYLNMTKDPFFSQYLIQESMNKLDESIVKALSYKTDYSESSFLPMFTNQCKNFDAGDVTMEALDAFDTKQGYREQLPTHKTASEAANTISISVTEDANLSFTKLMSIWVNYISNITDGTFDANPEMILNGTLDYMSSIYYFVLSPDGQTLKYWSKYTGCWPTNIPYGALKYSRGTSDVSELDINFNYTTKEDMNPKILEEFNIVSMKLTGTDILTALRNSTNYTNYYASISDSPLLNRDKMGVLPSANNILSSEKHDPVVLYVPGSDKGLAVDRTNSSFKLVFDKRGYKSELIDNILGSDGNYINDEASDLLVNGYNNKNWNETGYWSSGEMENIE